MPISPYQSTTHIGSFSSVCGRGVPTNSTVSHSACRQHRGSLPRPWSHLAALLWGMGVCPNVYINDMLVLVETRQKAEEQAEALVYILPCLGFVLNQKKLLLMAGQTMDFPGFTVDTLEMQLRLPGGKLKKIWEEVWKMVREKKVLARALSQLMEKMNATSQVIAPAPHFSDSTNDYLPNTGTKLPELQCRPVVGS